MHCRHKPTSQRRIIFKAPSMAQHSGTLTLRILVCCVACLSCGASAASEFLRRKGSLHQTSSGGRQRRVAEGSFLGWLNKQHGSLPPPGCNCGAKMPPRPITPCPVGFVAPKATIPPPALSNVYIPPLPPPLADIADPPPPLPPVPAKGLPGLPGLPGLTVAALPTLGPAPLWKMTPPPTAPPPVTTPPPPTTPMPVASTSWFETPTGLEAGPTQSPFLAFTTTSPVTTPGILPQLVLPGSAPAPAPALNFLQASRVEQPCDCSLSSPDGVDQAFASIMN